MCSYREQRKDELSLSEIRALAISLHEFGLKRIVFSGGEPLLRKDFPEICQIFSKLSVKLTLLTNGLLLHKRYEELKTYFEEIIVSIDGPDEQTHNSIRGISAFSQIVKGIMHVRETSPTQNISIRTVLQKRNYERLADMVRFAKEVGVNRISFLPADVLSDSFGRFTQQTVENQKEIILTEDEINRLRQIIKEMTSTFRTEFETGFISESPEKLHRIAHYYQALLEKADFPPVLCNAPNVSLVIQSNGELLPCFFLPSFGNIRQTPIRDAINSQAIQKTRTDVKKFEVERCKTCVCSLYVSLSRALVEKY